MMAAIGVAGSTAIIVILFSLRSLAALQPRLQIVMAKVTMTMEATAWLLPLLRQHQQYQNDLLPASRAADHQLSFTTIKITTLPTIITTTKTITTTAIMHPPIHNKIDDPAVCHDDPATSPGWPLHYCSCLRDYCCRICIIHGGISIVTIIGPVIMEWATVMILMVSLVVPHHRHHYYCAPPIIHPGPKPPSRPPPTRPSSSPPSLPRSSL
mmetsp:Transcript_40127/g.72302  ORF Transcript_40127/g.72302 Transcript_40127/m.72302 type:complete len:211 (+) Transcript_40127:517-1149(+)